MKADDTVKFEATATDPADATLTIANSDSLNKASFVALNESEKQVHIILEVTDDGTPPLVGYQRIICDIK